MRATNPRDVHIVIGGVDLVRLFRVVNHPAAIAAFDLEMVVAPASRRHDRSVVLRAAAETARIARCHVDVVIHRDRQSSAAVFPRRSTVIAYVDSAIVAIVNPAWCRHRHEQHVMVRVRVIGIAAHHVPVRDLLPGISAVGRPMQIDPATNHVVRIGRMHDNGIAVGHLAFAGEMRAGDVLPGVAAVACPENAEHVFVRCRDLKID